MSKAPRSQKIAKKIKALTQGSKNGCSRTDSKTSYKISYLNNATLKHCQVAVAMSTLAVVGVTQVSCAKTTYRSIPSYEDAPVHTPSGQINTQYGNQNYLNDTSINYFAEAKSAADRNDTNALYQYEQMMNGGLFAMYPAYWRLDNELSTLNPAAVAQFVRQYNGSVMAEKLAADYAEVKAGAGDYAAVRQVANLIENADDSERCAISLGFNGTGDSMRALALKSDVWLTTKKQPQLCQQLATEMISNRIINNQDRKNRLMRMLRIGRTGDIIALSQALGTPISYSELSAIQLSPSSFLNRMSNERYSQKNQYLYLYAIGRLADKSYNEAAMQVDFDVKQDNQRSQKLLSDTTRRYAYRTVAVKRMNFNTDDGFSQEAVRWFRNSLGEPFNFEEAEDYAQASIRFSQWSDVVNAISNLDAAVQQEPMWQYWLARAYEQSSKSSEKRLAKTIYKNVAKNNTYYGFLAKDRVGQRLNLARGGASNLPQVSSRDSNRVLQNPHFARAFALHNIDANSSFAKREWNWAVKKARDNRDYNLIIAAAKRAHDLGWFDRAIYALESTDNLNNYALSHPMPYRDSVIRYSRQVSIDPAWAYGIMRQESRFVSSARSGVGASGLMQIMPSTAKYIARNLGEPYSVSRANSGDTNIRYGTWYMSDVLGKLNYQPVLATAGYNAGPNKAKRWQPVYGSLAADQYVDTIAYPETRNYVKRVMENATIYSSLLGNPTSISQRMGKVNASY